MSSLKKFVKTCANEYGAPKQEGSKLRLRASQRSEGKTDLLIGFALQWRHRKTRSPKRAWKSSTDRRRFSGTKNSGWAFPFWLLASFFFKKGKLWVSKVLPPPWRLNTTAAGRARVHNPRKGRWCLAVSSVFGVADGYFVVLQWLTVCYWSRALWLNTCM